MVYADLKLDTSFKRTFANKDEKEPLIFMLNVFLARKLAHRIVDVDIKDPYVKGQTLESRDSIFDILCQDSEGNKFLVEIQIGRQAHFIKRVLYYVCMAVANSGKKGDWDFNYPPVYSLSFLSFDLDFGNDDVVQHLSLSNDEHPEIRYNYINMVFVRLVRFKKALDECDTLQDKLIFSLCHAHKLESKPEQFWEEAFDKLFELARISRFSLDERVRYEADMKNERDRYAALLCARNEGREEGRNEAREELLALWESGMSLDEAKQKLGLL